MSYPRNSLCWCGSGRKYKHCHRMRAQEQPLPLGALSHKLKKERPLSTCLHPEASANTCGKIINAHTLQRSGVLHSIIDDQNHVLSFYPMERDDDNLPRLQRVGWKRASVFTGFCQRHDDVTFAALEKMPFRGTKEQCFLAGYRALCHEVYQKSRTVMHIPLLRDNLDRGRDEIEQWRIQHRIGLQAAGVEAGRTDALVRKQAADEMLLSRNYDEWDYCTIFFAGEVSIASTGAPTPTYDLDRNRLQDLVREPLIQPLFCTVLTAESGGAVSFSWPKDSHAAHHFLESLFRKPETAIPNIIAQFIFAHIENTFFSKKWWEGLTDHQREYMRYLMGISNPYYQRIAYISEQVVNWRITLIDRNPA